MSVSAKEDAAQIDLAQLGPESIITFPQGLVGQPHWKRFVLLSVEGDGAVALLQSVDDQQLSLLVTDPRRVVADYTVALGQADVTLIGLETEEPVLLTTLSIYRDRITTNLLGPLVINPRTREAKQVVLADSPYTTQHPVGRVTPEELESCLS